MKPPAGATLPQNRQPRLRVVDCKPTVHDDSRELIEGLLTPPRTISPKFFYDTRGAELFAAITRLPEYYPTRTEKSILCAHLDEIAACIGPQSVLFEPGSGNSEKVRLLLDAVRPRCYVPMDISAAMLQQTAQELVEEFAWLQVHAICADFNDEYALSDTIPGPRRVAFYPGSTLGNLEPDAAIRFLQRLRRLLGADGGLLIGIDRHKQRHILEAAYNDRQGITAAFNRNALLHANRLLDANFDLEAFRHLAFYNNALRRIEMHLVSERDQQVHYRGGVFRFSAGERIHTENSYKYTAATFARLARASGFRECACWQDENALFSIHFLEVC